MSSSNKMPLQNITNLMQTKKKFSLDHTNSLPKEKISTQSLNYFISPRSSSEQIFKNLKNLAALNSAKSKTLISPKPLLNDSNSACKDFCSDKENFFFKYLKQNKDFQKTKQTVYRKQTTGNFEDSMKKNNNNAAEIIESLEVLKNRYKTLKEMHFLSKNKNSTLESGHELICTSKFSKLVSKNQKFSGNSEKNEKFSIENNENSTANTFLKKSTNLSNILSTNTNSESEIQQKSNEKNNEIETKEKNTSKERIKKNTFLFMLNKEKIMKIFQNMSSNKKPLFHPLGRNLSIPENYLFSVEKSHRNRRVSLHIDSKNKENEGINNDSDYDLTKILTKTKEVLKNYKIKEVKWKKEKNELNSQINELKKKLSLYEKL